MKQHITQSMRGIVANRYISVLLIVLIVLTIGVVSYIALTIQPSELRVVTHYSAYGVTHFYRDQWVYLLTFAVCAAINAVLGVLITAKLLQAERTSLAVLYAWVSIFIALFTWITYAHLVEFS